MNLKQIVTIVLLSATTSVVTMWGYNRYVRSQEYTYQPSSTDSGKVPSNYAGFNGLTGEAGPADFTAAAGAAIPATVHIKTKATRTATNNLPRNSPFGNLFPDLDIDDFFGNRMRSVPQAASGSGAIISEDGYIVTNNHVVDGADEITVSLNNKKSFKAKLVAADPSSDLAVIKIEAKGLPFLLYGNSDETKVGQWVLAVGYPLTLETTVTAGIISAKGRTLDINSRQSNTPVESFIQTDAAVNPGNSGGPLISIDGKLIGINSAIASPTGAYAGYSFTIPVNIVKKIVADLMKFGTVQRAFLGINYPRENLSDEVKSQNGITEGEGVYVMDVPADGAAASVGIKKGDIYNLETLNKKLGKGQMSPEGGDISGYYMDDGYLFFRVDPVETAVYNDTIDFEIRMVEGPQATIKNVTIAGNEKTKEHVIRRELRTLPGDKFSRSDLVRSNREIAQLGFFNQEKIGITPVPNPDDGTVDINYTVEEKSSDQLELSAGWGGGIGLTGTLGVSFNNFSIRNILKRSAWDPLPTGDGQKLSLRVQSNGRAYQSYNFSFTEPWLGGKKRNSLTVSAYKSVFRTGGIGSDGRYFYSDTNRLKNFGVSVALGKQLKWPDDYFTLVYSLSYTQYKLINYPLFTSDFRNGTSNNFSFKIALSRNSAGPNPIYPVSGSNFMTSLQLTPPYSLINTSITNKDSYKLPEYHKWRFNAEWFIPIGKGMGEDKSHQFVLRAAAKYGFIGRYNSKLNFSPFERFQVGDAGLANGSYVLGYDIIAHRGYPVYESSDPKVNPDQQSASMYFTMFNKYTLELRYPFATNPSSTIYATAWFEAANGWYDYKSYNPFRLRRSAGVGMRFFLPMFGLLGFDYGVGFDRLTPGNRLRDATRFTFMLGYEPE